jgi:hypothetical protein
MKFYGWVLLLFIILFPLCLLSYLFLGQTIVIENKFEKTPVFDVIKGQELSFFENKLDSVNFKSLISFGIIDKEIFAGDIFYDFFNDKITVRTVSKYLYDDLKSLIISLNTIFEERIHTHNFFGINLKYAYLASDYIDLFFHPAIYILDLSNYTEEQINFMSSSFFIFEENMYKSYSFNVIFLQAVNEYSAVLIDEKLLINPGVTPLIELLSENGVRIYREINFFNFKEGLR